MAHEITIRENGTAEAFFAGEAAWHNLGQVVNKTQKWEEAMKLAGLDWEVEKRPLFAKGPGPMGYEEVSARGLFRSDNNRFLSACGEDWTPIQNKDAFGFVDTLIAAQSKADGAWYETAGSLFGGERIWTLARLPDDIRIKGTDDVTQSFLLFTNAHKPGRSAIAKLTNVRVVCNNTLQKALRGGVGERDMIRIRHTPNTEIRLNEARKVLGKIHGQIVDLNDVFNILADTHVTMPVLKEILADIFPKIEESSQAQNRARTMLDLFEDNDRNAFPSEKGAAFALLNAGTRMTDHGASVRTSEGETEAQARARSALFGTGEAFKFALMQSIVLTLAKNSLASFPYNSVTEMIGIDAPALA